MDIDKYLIGKNEKEISPIRIAHAQHTMPKHQSKKWNRRNLDWVSKAIVHQSFTDYTNSTFFEMAEYHITPSRDNHLNPQGCPAIAYHYGIAGDGQIFQFHSPSAITWHTANEASYSLGIVVMGDFNGPAYDGVNEDPADAQLRSLYKLLNYLTDSERSFIIKPEDIYGHREFGRENCPGLTITEFLAEYRRKYRNNPYHIQNKK